MLIPRAVRGLITGQSALPVDSAGKANIAWMLFVTGEFIWELTPVGLPVTHAQCPLLAFPVGEAPESAVPQDAYARRTTGRVTQPRALISETTGGVL